MSIIQLDFEAGNFHVANDQPFQDERLSWQAKGVLGYLFSKPPDWTPRIYDIVQSGPCKRHKIKSVFEELEEAGYMKREKYRKGNGTFDWKVTVSDHPQFDPGWTESTPDAVHPGRNGGASNTDSKSKLNNNNTECESAPAREDSDKETALSIHQEWFPSVSLSIGQKQILKKKISDLGTWREVVEWWCGNGYKGRSISRMEQKYQEKLAEGKDSKLTPERKDDPDWTVNENGERCYKGTPISDIGPQNLTEKHT